MYVVYCGTVAVRGFYRLIDAKAFAASWERYGANVRIVLEPAQA